MYWDELAFSEVTDAAGYHATYFLDRRWGENHGVTIVGWDDAYPADRFQGDDGAPPADGAFLVRNTWGSDWGEDGSFWVSYYDRSFACDQGLGGYGGATSYAVVEDTANYTRAYQYDKLGVTDHWGFDSTRVWGANRFTVKSTQAIAAAGFYALSSSTRYEVWAGRTLGSSACAPPASSSCPATPPCRSPPGSASPRADASWSPSSWSHPARPIPWPSSAQDAAGCPAPRPRPARAT